MSDDCQFIPCLIIHRGELFRHFIDVESVTQINLQTKYGFLKSINTYNPPLPKAHGEYYRAFIYVRAGKRYNEQTYAYLGDFIRKLKERAFKETRSSDNIVIIVRFNSAEFDSPAFINEDDILVGRLKHYHSDSLKKWISTKIIDEFKPSQL